MFIYLWKKDIQLEDGAWYCSYASSYTVHRAIDCVDLIKNVQTTIRSQHVPVLGAFDGALGYGDPDNNHVANGEESEDELALWLVDAVPSIREVRDEIAHPIDARYYSVTVDEDRG